MTSLSSMLFKASDTASPTLAPVLRNSSAAAMIRGFSLTKAINYVKVSAHHLSAACTIMMWRSHTLARSYAARAFFMASKSWSLSTSPWSCLTLSCSSRFFLSSSFSTSTNVWKGDFGNSFERLEEWKPTTRPRVAVDGIRNGGGYRLLGWEIAR